MSKLPYHLADVESLLTDRGCDDRVDLATLEPLQHVDLLALLETPFPATARLPDEAMGADERVLLQRRTDLADAVAVLREHDRSGVRAVHLSGE